MLDAAVLQPTNRCAAERPGPLRNCSVLNRTTASLETGCQAGFHGGLQQWFTVTVRDSETHQLVANRSSALPRSVAGGRGWRGSDLLVRGGSLVKV